MIRTGDVSYGRSHLEAVNNMLEHQISRMNKELAEKDAQIEKLTMRLEERNNLIAQVFKVKVEEIS